MVLLEHRAPGRGRWWSSARNAACTAWPRRTTAAHAGASRSPQEVMEHYISMYIHGNLGKACIPSTIPSRVTGHTCPRGGPHSPSLITPLASPRHLGGRAAAGGLHAAAGRLRDREQPRRQDTHQRVLSQL